MDYNIRAFCIANEVPTLAELIGWLKTRDVSLSVQGMAPDQLEVRNWQRASLVYREGRPPLVAECFRKTRVDDCQAATIIKGFLDRVGPPGKSASKRRVTSHLKETQFVIILHLPVDDMDDKGYDANGQILTYLSQFCNGLIQADREGFYEGDKLILPVEG